MNCKAVDLTPTYLSGLISYHCSALAPPQPRWPLANAQIYQSHYNRRAYALAISSAQSTCQVITQLTLSLHSTTPSIYHSLNRTSWPFFLKLGPPVPSSFSVFLSCFDFLPITYLALQHTIICLFVHYLCPSIDVSFMEAGIFVLFLVILQHLGEKKPGKKLALGCCTNEVLFAQSPLRAVFLSLPLPDSLSPFHSSALEPIYLVPEQKPSSPTQTAPESYL